MIARVPSDFLGIVYDPTNLITPETASKQVEIVAEAFEKFGERIVCLHLKDYVIEEDRIVSVPLGEGIIPYQAIYKSLTNTNLIAMSYWREQKTKKSNGRLL